MTALLKWKVSAGLSGKNTQTSLYPQSELFWCVYWYYYSLYSEESSVQETAAAADDLCGDKTDYGENGLYKY